MAGKKKNTPATTAPPELPVGPEREPKLEPAAVVAPRLAINCPSLIEYEFKREAWRCERFDLLVAEFFESGAEEDWRKWIITLHEVASQRARGWLIVRRIYGLQPVLGDLNGDPADMQVWERRELQESMGLTRQQLQDELDAVRGAWRAVRQAEARPADLPLEAAKTPGKDLFEEDAVIKQFGFRIEWQDRTEMVWFAARVKAFERVLAQNFTFGLGWNILHTELHQRRLEADMAKSVVIGDQMIKLHALRAKLNETYNKQMEQLDEKCPWASGIAGKYAFHGVMSDVTRAIQEYHARGDTRLVDGIFTATEIQVELRRSVQSPDVRYRAGLVVYLNQAKAGMWDPNWKPSVDVAVLKRLDRSWQAAARAIGDESGEPVPDLEVEGPDGEYEELRMPTELKEASET